jgi:FAD:protein FMN transferase
MGTEVAMIADDGDGSAFDDALRLVMSIFEREEQRFSRFRPDSELSDINRSSSRWVDVSQGFADVVALALAGAETTGGLFDPTILRALEGAGYDRDFGAVAVQHRPAPVPSGPCGGWRDVELVGTRLFRPPGVAFDLGGIAKGWTVDVAVEAAIAVGLRWVVVNAGGDLRVRGAAPALSVGIEDPVDRGSTFVDLAIDGGALATTSVMLRSWGADLHHVIDPRIGRPARTPVVQATAWEPTCAAAEISAKRAVLEGIPALEHISGVVVLKTGEIVMNIGAAA